jgi:DeoR family glycerol-3-phosphate regulon repressor
MPSTEREHAIIKRLQETGSARIPDLARHLGVTTETIRRNVKRLEALGSVTKVHGGVHLKDWGSEPSFALRVVQNAAAKRRIASRTADLVADGASIFLDVGSTTAYVAQALRRRRELRVVTNSLSVATALVGVNGNRVFLAGGEMRGHDGGAFGIEALGFIRQFRLGTAILSAAGINAASGFMLQDLPEAEFCRAVIAQSDRVVFAADATKFNTPAAIRITQTDRIHSLVTDAAPPSDIAAHLHHAGVQIILA